MGNAEETAYMEENQTNGREIVEDDDGKYEKNLA